ncbi:MAG: hypothetical protein AAGE94_01970 [Acidobacteriota bacterium]
MSFPLLDFMHRRRSHRAAQLLLAVGFFCIAIPAAAGFGSTHAVVLMPGLEEVEVSIAGWLVPDGQAYTATVIEAPRFGTWTQEVFRPDDAFWAYGGDRVVLSVTSGEETAVHTIVLRAVRPYDVWRVREDFEASGGVLSSTNLGQIGDTARLHLTDDALDGLWSLQVDLIGGGAALQAEGDGGGDITGIDQIGGRAAVNPDLPDGGGNFPLANQPFVLFELNDVAQAQLRFRSVFGQKRAEVRAQLDDAAFSCAPRCTTPWRVIPGGESTAIGLWYGSDLGGHPDERLTSAHLVVDTPTSRFRDTLADLPARRFPEPKWTVGAVRESSIGVPGSLRLDLLEGWWQAERAHSAIGPTVIDEDVSGGSFDPRWQVIGPITPETPVRDPADPHWLAQVDLDDVAKGAPALLVDEAPRWATEIRVEMLAGLGSANLGEGRVYTIWGATTIDGTVGTVGAPYAVTIDVGTFSGGRYVRARAMDDLGVRHTTRWLPVDPGSAETPIVLAWWQVTHEVPGGLRLLVGDEEASLDGLVNANLTIREHAVGAWDVRTEGRAGMGFSTARPFLLLDDVLVVY